MSKSSEQEDTITVLHVGPLPPPVGGMSVFFEELAQSHLDGYAFSVLATNQINKSKFAGWKRRCMNLINAILLTGRYLKILLCLRPQIVHVQTNSGPGFFEKASLLLWAKVIRAKTVLHIHGGRFHDFYRQSGGLFQRGIRFCLNRPHRIVVLSEQMKSVFQSIGVAGEKLAIVQNGVLMPDQATSGKSTQQDADGSLTVLFLNRIDVPKGIEELLEAAELVCRKTSHVRFRIVGPASSRHWWVLQELQEKDIFHRVQIEGPVTGQDKTMQYSQADIYVLPSHLEALPIGLLEAMSHGLACVATTVGAIPEIIEDGVNGLLVPPKDARKLAEAILKLIGDSESRDRFGANARRTVELKYTWQHTLQALKTTYDSLIAQKDTGE